MIEGNNLFLRMEHNLGEKYLETEKKDTPLWEI